MEKTLTVLVATELQNGLNRPISVSLTIFDTVKDIKQKVADAHGLSLATVSIQLFWNTHPILNDNKDISDCKYILQAPTLKAVVSDLSHSPGVVADSSLNVSDSDDYRAASFISDGGADSYPKVLLTFAHPIARAKRGKLETDLIRDFSEALHVDSNDLSFQPPESSSLSDASPAASASSSSSSPASVASGMSSLSIASEETTSLLLILGDSSKWEDLFSLVYDMTMLEKHELRCKHLISAAEFISGSGLNLDAAWKKKLIDNARKQIFTFLESSKHEFVLKDILCTHSAPDASVIAAGGSSSSSFIPQGAKMLVYCPQMTISRATFEFTHPQRRPISGEFGTGFYLTSFLDHAIFHQDPCGEFMSLDPRERPEGEEIYVFGVAANVGKAREITSQSPGAIPPGFDSNHMTYGCDGHDEWVIKNPRKLRLMFAFSLLKVKKMVIWRDTNIANEYNSLILSTIRDNFKTRFNIHAVSTTADALRVIERKYRTTHIILITNGGDDGEGLVRQFRALVPPDYEIIVFCYNLAAHSVWARNYPNVNITNDESIFKNTLRAFIDR